MKRDVELQLIDRALEQTRERTLLMPDDESHSPVERYLDRERFSSELDVLFRRRPVLVCASRELPDAGAFLTRRDFGVPMLLTRQADGTAQAFINVCRHRGAQVERREAGAASRFVCPYHGWSYKSDGSLAAVPDEVGFPSLDKSCSGLVTLPTLEAGGAVFVTHASDGQRDTGLGSALLDEIAGLGMPDLAVFRRDSRVWKANWKIVMEGGLESYHFKVAHRNSIGPYFMGNAGAFDLYGPHIRAVLPRRSIAKLLDVPREQWRLRDHANMLYSIFPNASLLVQQDHIMLITVVPHAVDETEIRLATLAPHDQLSPQRAEHWSQNHEISWTALEEDFTLAEEIQSGMASGANKAVRFGRFEAALSHVHREIDEALAGRS